MAKTFCRRRARVYDGRLGSLGGWTMIAILRTAALAATAIGGALVAGPAFTQGGGPVARYTLDAGTIGGMGAMARGGGGMGAAMAMMRGGGGPAHELVLRLGSTRTPTGGAPQATHFLPQTARFGPQGEALHALLAVQGRAVREAARLQMIEEAPQMRRKALRIVRVLKLGKLSLRHGLRALGERESFRLRAVAR